MSLIQNPADVEAPDDILSSNSSDSGPNKAVNESIASINQRVNMSNNEELPYKLKS